MTRFGFLRARMSVGVAAVSVVLFVAQTASAATIAVIDSGTDIKHKAFTGKIWTNADETASNNKDDDKNGYVDDINGWNFAEKNNQVIDYKYLGTFSPDCTKFFDIQTKKLLGTATPDELQWMDQKRKDEEFLKELGKFGNFVHGTHVSGVTAEQSPGAQILAVKLIPTEVKQSFRGYLDRTFGSMGLTIRPGSVNPITDFLIKAGLGQLAKQQGAMLAPIGKYVNDEKANVANCSFGVDVHNAQELIGQLLTGFGVQLTDEEKEVYGKHFVGEVVKSQESFINAAPKTLFVIAAGNSSQDNDVTPAAPTNIKKPNTISVAATSGLDKLASFSSYGKTMVDVAAPGVGIDSTIPGDQFLRMSGTSMAAPYVANVAAQAYDANPMLTPDQIRKVLIGTVDRKAFLDGKVSSGGIVNLDRAVKAAEFSRKLSLDEAISQARLAVADQKPSAGTGLSSESESFALPLFQLFR